jgi:hypothetical protein
MGKDETVRILLEEVPSMGKTAVFQQLVVKLGDEFDIISFR